MTSKKEQKPVTPEEKAEREATGATQGRKGCKKPGKRLNLLLSPDNHEFVEIMARATGRSMTDLINDILTAYRNEHPEFLEKAESFLDFVNSGAFMDNLKFKAWLAENRIKQKEIMELLDLSRTSIDKKINGKEDFTLPQIRTICDKYGITADIFL